MAQFEMNSPLGGANRSYAANPTSQGDGQKWTPDRPQSLQERPTRVLIVDDFSIVRSGVRAYLGADCTVEIVGEANDGDDAVRQVAGFRRDVVMDLRMPRLDGVVATAMTRRENPTIEVVVLSEMLEASWVVSAVRAGAVGFLGKSANRDHLREAVRQARVGQVHLTPEAAETLMREMRALEMPETFSECEMAILRLLVRGQGDQQIAEMLRVGVRTVRSHVGRIMLKLGVERRGQSALRAVHLGLLPPHAAVSVG